MKLVLPFLMLATVVLAEIELVVPGQPRTRGNSIAVPSPGDTASRTATAEKTDVMIFRNGDVLHGTLLGIIPDAEIRWGHPEAKRAIEFSPENVAQIKLVALKSSGDTPAQQSVIRLTNGDQLRGELIALDADKLTLNTWYAGELTIQRAMLQSITPKAGVTTALYVGPTGLEDWVRPQGDSAWSYKNGAFITTMGMSGVIGREMKLKDRSRIEFDLAWRQYPYLQVALYNESLENFYGNCYMLQISQNSVYLQRGRARSGFNNLPGGQVNLENLQQKGHARLTLLVDKAKRTIALLVDGALVKQWIDPGEFAGAGTSLMFQSQGQGSMKLSNLVVAEWDGEIGGDNTLSAKQEDMIRFINNDKVSGQLKAIAKGMISFATAFATLDVPTDRAAQIEFASEKSERARRQATDVRAFFADGGSVTLALEKLDEQSVVGNSENFGKRTFVRNAFRELRLHIYDETIQSAKADEWEF